MIIELLLPSNEVKLAETRGFMYKRVIGEGIDHQVVQLSHF